MIRRWPALAALVALAGSASPAVVAAPGFATDLHPGDVVLRAGRGHEALAVSLASGAQLTHVGLVTGFDAAGQPIIIHADPQGGDAAVVRAEPLADFAAPAVASAVQVWRPRYASSASRAAIGGEAALGDCARAVVGNRDYGGAAGAVVGIADEHAGKFGIGAGAAEQFGIGKRDEQLVRISGGSGNPVLQSLRQTQAFGPGLGEGAIGQAVDAGG